MLDNDAYTHKLYVLTKAVMRAPQALHTMLSKLLRSVMSGSPPQTSLFPSLARTRVLPRLFVLPGSEGNCQLIPIRLTQARIRAEQTTDRIHMRTHAATVFLLFPSPNQHYIHKTNYSALGGAGLETSVTIDVRLGAEMGIERSQIAEYKTYFLSGSTGGITLN